MVNNLFKHFLLTKSLIALCCCLFSLSATAQTDTLINPTKEGGFELGNGSFAANGWSVAADNATQVNQWTANRGASQGFSGNYCAYITDQPTATPPPHRYTTQQASTVHFYRDVTFKAGKTRAYLSFTYTNTVYEAPFRVAIVHRDSALTTGTTLGTYYSYGYTTTSIDLDPSVIGNCGRDTTVRLVFTWTDPVSGYFSQPPPAIDNILLIERAISPIFSGIDSVFTIDKTQPTTGTNFNSFKDAINALNLDANGRCNRTKPMLFKVTAGQSFEDISFAITASGTAAAPIVFQKSGVGANPVIKPKAASGYNGYGLYIYGGDYLTFDGIDIDGRVDSATQNLITIGYYIKSASPTDGAQNITIKNCNITRSRHMSDCAKKIFRYLATKYYSEN